MKGWVKLEMKKMGERKKLTGWSELRLALALGRSVERHRAAVPNATVAVSLPCWLCPGAGHVPEARCRLARRFGPGVWPSSYSAAAKQTLRYPRCVGWGFLGAVWGKTSRIGASTAEVVRPGVKTETIHALSEGVWRVSVDMVSWSCGMCHTMSWCDTCRGHMCVAMV